MLLRKTQEKLSQNTKEGDFGVVFGVRPVSSSLIECSSSSDFDLFIGTRLWVQEHIHRQLFLIYIRWFVVLWSRFYCDLLFKFLRGSPLFAGIPSVGEQDTVHPVAEMEHLVVLVGF